MQAPLRDPEFQHPNPPQQALTQTDMGGIPIAGLQWPCPQPPPPSGPTCVKPLLSPASVPNSLPTPQPAPPRPQQCLVGPAGRGARCTEGTGSPSCRLLCPTRLQTGSSPPGLGPGDTQGGYPLLEDRQAGASRLWLGLSRSAQRDMANSQNPGLQFPAQPKGPVHQTYLGR